MKPEECPELDSCYKIKIILDKDLLDEQYAQAIRAVCAKCDLAKSRKGEVMPVGEDELKIDPEEN